jgi:hypothetical protein
MGAQHSAICRRKFCPTRHPDYHNVIGEDRRLLRLIGQSVNAPKPDEDHTQCQDHKHPPPAPKWASIIRLVCYGATDRMRPRRLSDAG